MQQIKITAHYKQNQSPLSVKVRGPLVGEVLCNIVVLSLACRCEQEVFWRTQRGFFGVTKYLAGSVSTDLLFPVFFGCGVLTWLNATPTLLKGRCSIETQMPKHKRKQF